RLEMRQFGLHAFDRVDDVGAWLTEDNRENGWASLRQADITQVLDGIHDVGDVGETHGGVVAIGNDKRDVVGGSRRLIVGVDLAVPCIVLNVAFRAVGVGGSKRRAHVLKPNAIFG